MFNDYFRGKVYRFILRSSFAYPSLKVRWDWWRVVAVRKVLFYEGKKKIAPTI